jgi:hypothetical protein
VFSSSRRHSVSRGFSRDFHTGGLWKKTRRHFRMREKCLLDARSERLLIPSCTKSGQQLVEWLHLIAFKADTTAHFLLTA